jgi:hypothetical protein
MAARGSSEKEFIKNKLLEVFEGSFIDDKVIRIPINDMEIKVTLTAAKDVIGGGGSIVTSGSNGGGGNTAPKPNPADFVNPTEDEKTRVKELLEELGF